MNAPAIEFCIAKSAREFERVRSSNAAVRFRIRRRSERTEFDAEFFSTRWELAPSAWEQIKYFWDSECKAHPCRRASFGGGRSCIVFAVLPEREGAWQTFLLNLLSRSESWLMWNDRRAAFVPQPIEQEKAAA